MKRYKPNKDVFITEYASIQEFIQTINSLPNNKYFKNQNSSHDGSESFCGTKSYEEAEQLLVGGWEEGSELLSQKVKPTQKVSATVKSSRPVYSVIGSQASVPRYLQGIPTNMISRKATYTKQKVVTLTKGISYSVRFSQEKIIEESMKALQVVQALENGGQRVRLNVMLATSYLSQSSVCKVCVKQPDERMNISKMAFALAHPSMLRRFMLRWIETDPFVTFNLGCAYGKSSEQSVKELAMDKNEYYLPEEIDDINKLISEINGK